MAGPSRSYRPYNLGDAVSAREDRAGPVAHVDEPDAIARRLGVPTKRRPGYRELPGVSVRTLANLKTDVGPHNSKTGLDRNSEAVGREASVLSGLVRACKALRAAASRQRTGATWKQIRYLHRPRGKGRVALSI